MTRDPSDGSVRTGQAALNASNPGPLAHGPGAMPMSEPGMTGISPAISGLPTGSTKPENISRLDKSRDWLKNYFQRKTGAEQ